MDYNPPVTHRFGVSALALVYSYKPTFDNLNERAQMAFDEVRELMALYRRVPARAVSSSAPPITSPVTQHYFTTATTNFPPTTHLYGLQFAPIAGSLPARGLVEDKVKPSSESSDDGDVGEETFGDEFDEQQLRKEAETALRSYSSERSIGPEDIDKLTPLFSSKPAFRWHEYALYGF